MANSIFFNSNAKILESKLLGYGDYEFLYDAEAFEDILSFLRTKDIDTTGASIDNLMICVRNETKKFVNYLKSNSPSAFITNYFLCEYDLTNLKFAYLEKLLGEDFERFFDYAGVYDKNLSREIISLGRYSSLPVSYKKIFDSLAMMQSSVTMDLVDEMFFKCKVKIMAECSEKNMHLKKIFDIYRIATNLLLAVKIGDKKQFDSLKLCGVGEDKVFDTIIEKNETLVIEELKFFEYLPIVKILFDCKNSGDYGKFYLFLDNLTYKYLSSHRLEDTTDLPYISYCFYKKFELINLQMIFFAKKYGIPRDKVFSNLRGVYEK